MYGQYRGNIPMYPSSLIVTNMQTLASGLADRLTKVDAILFDEIQYAASEQFHHILLKLIRNHNVRLMIGMSATPLTRDADQEERLSTLFPLEYGRALIDIDLPTAIEDGVVVKPILYFDYVGNDRNTENVQHIWTSIIEHVIEFNPIRGRYGRWIVFTHDCEDVDMMWAYGRQYCHRHNISVRRTHSNLRRYDEGFIDSTELGHMPATFEVIVVCDQLRVGVDVMGLVGAFITRGHVPSGHLLVQMLGRTLRRSGGKESARFVVFLQDAEEREEYYLEFADGFYRSLSDWIFGSTGLITPSESGTSGVLDVREYAARVVHAFDHADDSCVDDIQTLVRNVVRRMCESAGRVIPYYKFLTVVREMKIRSAEDYRVYRESIGIPAGLPLSPIGVYQQDGWPGWYSYFQPDVQKKTVMDMYRVIQRNQLYSPVQYTEWQCLNLDYPTVDDIANEYFLNKTSFHRILDGCVSANDI